MDAYKSELKLSNHDNENVSGKCNLTFLQSFLSQQKISPGMLSVYILS